MSLEDLSEHEQQLVFEGRGETIVSVDAERGFDNNGAPIACLAIATGMYHATFEIREEEIDLFLGASEADWNRRDSRTIGRCLGSKVFWCSDATSISVLIGHDDESWSICFTLPPPTLKKISDVLAPLRSWLLTTPYQSPTNDEANPNA